MKIRCWSKPGIYLVVLHNNSDKEPTTAITCFRFSGRLKSQHALKVSRTSWGYTVVELKHITKKSTNQSRVHVRQPKCDWPSKDHSSPPLSRPAIFLSVCAFFLLECPSRVHYIYTPCPKFHCYLSSNNEDTSGVKVSFHHPQTYTCKKQAKPSAIRIKSLSWILFILILAKIYLCAYGSGGCETIVFGKKVASISATTFVCGNDK